MATLLSDLVSEIRLLSGLRSNQLYTDADIAGMASDVWLELYDRFVAANQHYRIKEFDFTLAGGVGGNSVELPSDFQLGNGLELNPSYPRPQSVKYLDNWLNRNNLGATVLNVAGGLIAMDRQYCFNDNQLKVFPSTSSAGDYRLYYTPQAEKFLAPVTQTIEIDGLNDNLNAPTSIPPFVAAGALAAWIFTNADLTDVPTDGTATLTVDLDSPNDIFNGTYPILATIIPPDATYPEIGTALPADSTGWTGPEAGTASITYQPAGTISELPAYVDPWALYIKLGTSIAIREARQQDVADLERRMNSQKLRVDQMLQNRQEEPTQPPLSSGRSFWDSL